MNDCSEGILKLQDGFVGTTVSSKDESKNNIALSLVYPTHEFQFAMKLF